MGGLWLLAKAFRRQNRRQQETAVAHGKEPLMHNETIERPTAVIGDGRAASRVRLVARSVAWAATIRDGMHCFVRTVFAVAGAELPPDAGDLEHRLQMTSRIRYR